MSDTTVIQRPDGALHYGPPGHRYPEGEPQPTEAFSIVPLLPNYQQGPTDSITWTVEGETEAVNLVVDASDPKSAALEATNVNETKAITLVCTIDGDLDEGEERLFVVRWNRTVYPYEIDNVHATP